MGSQKTVVIGVSGCIAAYKACEIVRGLQKADVRAKVVMTEHATHFVDPLTFRALTHEPVAVGLFDDPSDPIHHISLAQEADVLLLAPCTANVLAKAAHGIADDLLTTTVLATTAPVLVAPAMNVHMYENAATQANMALLKERGFEFVEADEGYLACGDVGRGRLAEPERIVEAALEALAKVDAATATDNADETDPRTVGAAASVTCDGSPAARDFAGKHILVTAGPTVERIDPVRYLTNRSSGKFGYAIAAAAARRGARVTLVSGPVSLPAPDGVEVCRIESACEMLAACQEAFPTCDAAICAAAVADMRPARPADHKLKKGVDDEALGSIALEQNPDILATLAASKGAGQAVIGFAAETDHVMENAQKKLVKKGADAIVANQVGDALTFGQDDDEIWIVTAEGIEHPARAPKTQLAEVVLDAALALLE